MWLAWIFILIPRFINKTRLSFWYNQMLSEKKIINAVWFVFVCLVVFFWFCSEFFHGQVGGLLFCFLGVFFFVLVLFLLLFFFVVFFFWWGIFFYICYNSIISTNKTNAYLLRKNRFFLNHRATGYIVKMPSLSTPLNDGKYRLVLSNKQQTNCWDENVKKTSKQCFIRLSSLK